MKAMLSKLRKAVIRFTNVVCALVSLAVIAWRHGKRKP